MNAKKLVKKPKVNFGFKETAAMTVQDPVVGRILEYVPDFISVFGDGDKRESRQFLQRSYNRQKMRRHHLARRVRRDFTGAEKTRVAMENEDRFNRAAQSLGSRGLYGTPAGDAYLEKVKASPFLLMQQQAIDALPDVQREIAQVAFDLALRGDAEFESFLKIVNIFKEIAQFVAMV